MSVNRIKKGFTLIELLVVISIIALLISILMPALNKAREQAAGSVCLGNQKAMILAWLMYADDNDGYMVGGNSYYRSPSWPGTEYTWCKVPGYKSADATFIPWDESGGDIQGGYTLKQARLTGIREGKLYPYVNTTDIYNCPGDSRWRKSEPPYDVYRSYSINGMMYGEDARPGHNYLNAYKKLSQIRQPAGKFVVVEEGVRTQWFNLGSWVLSTRPKIEDYEWWDEFAVWHNGRSTFNFADGHAEMKTWDDKRTIQMSADPLGGNSVMRSNRPINPDLLWSARGYGGVPY